MDLKYEESDLEKGEVELWKRNPVTQWFLDALAKSHPLDWESVPDWDATNRLKGQAEVLKTIRDLLGPP